MARAYWLPEVLRDAGLVVHEEPGWRTRGYDGFRPVAVVCHATGGTGTDRQEINVIAYTGSETAPAPIAQLYLNRKGEYWVIATGTCNHIGDARLPGTGESGNNNALGIEAANDNRGEPWPVAQYRAYVRGVAAICEHMGWDTDRVFGHKEISYTGKTDPSFSMRNFRDRVAEQMGGDMPTPDEVAKAVWNWDHIKNTSQNTEMTPATFLSNIEDDVDKLRAQVRALSDKVDAIGTAPTPTIDYEKLAAALAPHLARLDIVLTPSEG